MGPFSGVARVAEKGVETSTFWSTKSLTSKKSASMFVEGWNVSEDKCMVYEIVMYYVRLGWVK